MDDSIKYVLVTREILPERTPKVLEDYIYSLNMFSDIIHLQDFTIEYFIQNKNTIFVITQMWLHIDDCLLYTSPSPRDGLLSRMPSSA